MSDSQIVVLKITLSDDAALEAFPLPLSETIAETVDKELYRLLGDGISVEVLESLPSAESAANFPEVPAGPHCGDAADHLKAIRDIATNLDSFCTRATEMLNIETDMVIRALEHSGYPTPTFPGEEKDFTTRTICPRCFHFYETRIVPDATRHLCPDMLEDNPREES